MICRYKVSSLHRLRVASTFTVYVTACDFEKSFSFDNAVEITNHIRFPQHRSTTVFDQILNFMGILNPPLH